MEPNRREFIKQCAFQKFCNTVLHNEACDAHKELHRHKAREITFSDVLFRGNERHRDCGAVRYVEKHDTVQADKLF